MRLKNLPGEPAPVTVAGADCVRSRCKNATCRACADACAPKAIAITADGITLNHSCCNRCGNCLFVCPNDALHGSAPLRRITNGRLTADNSPPPAHEELLQLAAHHGLQALAAHRGSPWQAPFEAANRLLEALGNEPLQWIADETANAMPRRALFRRLIRYADAVQAKTGLGAMLRAYPGLRFFHIELDIGACTLCAACTRICPHQALRASAEGFMIDAERCTGCRLCQDSCLEGAIRVSAQAGKASIESLPLRQTVCAACGRTFLRWPEAETPQEHFAIEVYQGAPRADSTNSTASGSNAETTQSQNALCPICRKRELLYGAGDNSSGVYHQE